MIATCWTCNQPFTLTDRDLETPGAKRCPPCHKAAVAAIVADGAYVARGFSLADDDGHAGRQGFVEELRGMP